MKKLARLLGVAGGLVAILWAMRDRFVSIASPREPEPPRFRMPTDLHTATGDDGAQASETAPGLDSPYDLTSVKGIGPAYAQRLQQAGITTLAALAAAPPDRVAEAAQVSIERAEEWVAAAAATAPTS